MIIVTDTQQNLHDLGTSLKKYEKRTMLGICIESHKKIVDDKQTHTLFFDAE